MYMKLFFDYGVPFQMFQNNCIQSIFKCKKLFLKNVLLNYQTSQFSEKHLSIFRKAFDIHYNLT